MPIKPGDEITADFLNRLEHSAGIVQAQELGGPTPPLRLQYDSNLVTVKNSSGADRRRGEIVGFTGASPLTNPAEPWLTGGSPLVGKMFGVLLNPIRSNAFGNRDCQIDGGCFALVTINDTNHTFAYPKSGTYVLESAPVGPVRILYKPSGTGEKTCFVQLNTPMPMHALASLGTTLNAYTTNLTSPPGGGMPSATGSLYTPQLTGGGVVMAGANELANQTYYNPTPFKYTNGDLLWLKNSGGLWLVESCHNWKPGAMVGANAGTTLVAGGISGTDPVVVDWSAGGLFPGGIYCNNGNIVSLQDSGTSIRIECPAGTSFGSDGWYSVTCSLGVFLSVGTFTGGGWDWFMTFDFPFTTVPYGFGLGQVLAFGAESLTAGGQGQHTHPLTPTGNTEPGGSFGGHTHTVRPNLANAHTASFSTTFKAQFGQLAKIRVSVGSGVAVSGAQYLVQGTINIDPLF